MARPIESTPILDAEEWNVFMNTVQQTKYTPLGVHKVDVERIRGLLKHNQEDLELFRAHNDGLVDAIEHTTFEDGKDNDVTLLVKSFVRRNPAMAYQWLHELFMSNQTTPVIMAGLLRTLSMVSEKGSESIVLDMVKVGLSSGDSSVQEAAIMVIEEWRTEKCLVALRQEKSFASEWLEKYATLVAHELDEELSLCSC